MEQFAHAAHAAVAEVVDVVNVSHAVTKSYKIVYGCNYVVHQKVLCHKAVGVLLDKFFKLLGVARRLFHERAEHGVINFFVYAEFVGRTVNVALEVYLAVAHYGEFAFFARHRNGNLVYARVLNGYSNRLGYDFALANVQHAVGVDNVLRGCLPRKTGGKREFFVVFVSAYAAEVVFAAVEEQALDVAADTVYVGNFARAELAVEFHKSFVGSFGKVFIESARHQRLVVEELEYLLVRSHGVIGRNPTALFVLAELLVARYRRQSTHEHRSLHLAHAVYLHPKHALVVFGEFEPRPARRYVGCVVVRCARLVVGRKVKVHAGRAHELTHHNAFRAVYYKRTVGSHEREIAHVNFLFYHLARFGLNLPYVYLEGRGVSRVALFALFLVVLGLVFQSVPEKMQLDAIGKIGDGRKILEHFVDTVAKKFFVTRLLHLYEVRHIDDFMNLRKALALGVAVFHRFDSSFSHFYSPVRLYFFAYIRACAREETQRAHFSVYTYIYGIVKRNNENILYKIFLAPR